MKNFCALQGWTVKFKNRDILATRGFCGVSSSVNEGMVEQCKEDLSALVNGQEPKNIYNCYETGLVYKILPDKTLKNKREPYQG